MVATRSFATPRYAAAAFAALAAALWLDVRTAGWLGQLAASAMVWAVFLALAQRSPPHERWMLVKCLLLATIGELVCSLAWGLYDYRFGNIPAFVPPGHVLMLALGMTLAARLNATQVRWTGVLAFGGLAAAALATGDHLSLPLLAVIALLWIARPRERGVFAVMLPLSLALELSGTWFGVWTWRPEAPLLRLPAHNPPFGAAAFYCMLDWLVLVRWSQVLQAPRHQRIATSSAMPGSRAS